LEFPAKGPGIKRHEKGKSYATKELCHGVPNSLELGDDESPVEALRSRRAACRNCFARTESCPGWFRSSYVATRLNNRV